MYAVCVTFRIRPSAMERFLPRMHQQARDSLTNEGGCHRFDVCTDPADPNSVFLYELYEDRSAFDRHNESAHFRSFAADVAEFIAGKNVSTFKNVAIGVV